MKEVLFAPRYIRNKKCISTTVSQYLYTDQGVFFEGQNAHAVSVELLGGIQEGKERNES